VLESPEDKVKRKSLNTEIDGVSEKIYTVFEKCEDTIAKLAETEKATGNDFFKQGKYAQAVSHYTIAISIDKSNAIFYTNRALAYQKLGEHPKAIADAKKSRSLDVNYLKAYVILTKSYLAIGDVNGARETLNAIPLASQEKADVLDLKVLTSAAAKDAGNVYFKKGQKDEAIKMYSTAIAFQPENHLLYSNRSAALQSKGSWAEALSDAQKCVQICETFFKGWLHMGRCQVRRRGMLR
jgi:stress-induced-phosphoprotein 1